MALRLPRMIGADALDHRLPKPRVHPNAPGAGSNVDDPNDTRGVLDVNVRQCGGSCARAGTAEAHRSTPTISVRTRRTGEQAQNKERS